MADKIVVKLTGEARQRAEEILLRLEQSANDALDEAAPKVKKTLDDVFEWALEQAHAGIDWVKAQTSKIAPDPVAAPAVSSSDGLPVLDDILG